MTDDGLPPDDGERTAPLESRLRELHRHLAATAEVPIDRKTNRWLGEADAVARDVATSDLEHEIVRERIENVRNLLAAAGEPDHGEAREHLEAARRLCDEILAE